MLLCKLCHGEFDPDAVVERALTESDSVFWVCIFANDIGAPPKPGSDTNLRLSTDTVKKWKIDGIPVRYGHTSDPIGRVLFGWHIHWDDKPTFACASLSTIKQASFQTAAPILLTVACQASLGTVNGVPDEISITLLGARDDTIGLFCSRDSLRELLTRFRFFAEPIKQSCCRASNFGRSIVKDMSTSTSPAGDPSQSQSCPSNAGHAAAPLLPSQQAQSTEDKAADEHVLEVEEVARQVQELREKFENQAEAMNLIRGMMEEWSIKGVNEMKASEAPGASKIRRDLDRMVAAGIIRTPDDTSQPRVEDVDAIRSMMDFNMKQFPAALAKSFRDTIQNILEPTAVTPASEVNESGTNEPLPSIGTSLVAVRATALRAAANVVSTSETVRASATAANRSNPAPRKHVTSLQKIHQALAQKLTPGQRKYGPFASETSEEILRMNPTKFRKMIKETVHDAIQDCAVSHQQSIEEEEKNSLFEAFRQFLANCQQRPPPPSPQQQQQQQQHSVPDLQPHSQTGSHRKPTQPQGIPIVTSVSNPGTSALQEPTFSEVSTMHPKTQTTVRASGLSLPVPLSMESSNISLKDLNIFY